MMLSEKIKIKDIIKEHLKTLYDAKNKTNRIHLYKDIYIMPDDLFTFFILPLIISLILVFLGGLLNIDISNALLTAMTILTPFLLSLLILVYDMSQKLGRIKDNRSYFRRLKLLKEMKANISFSILMTLLSVIPLILYSLFGKGVKIFGMFLFPYEIGLFFVGVGSFFTYFLIGVSIMTLLMILYRLNRMIDESFEDAE